MRILLLCDRYPDSLRDGLLLRVLHLARQLRSRHTLDLLCFHSGDADGEPAALFDTVWTVPRPARPAVAAWRAPFAGWTPRALTPFSPAVVDLLNGAIDPRRYDVVWDAGANMLLHLPPRWDGVPVVADLVDDMVLTFQRALNTATGWGDKLRAYKYLSLNRRYERDCMRRAAHCCVVSEEDAASFRSVSPRVPVSVIQNGVDLDYFAPGDGGEDDDRIVFEGSMAFEPNIEAAQFLVREVMPLVWQARPEATLALVGRDPVPAVRALAGPRVTVTGSVPDVRPFVQHAAVFACPLRSGAGIKNKLLQAWAMGKAVVATSMSVGGLGAQDGLNLLIRDDAPAIAAALVELLADPARRAALGRAGRQAVVERFAWSAQAQRFEALLSTAAQAAGAPGRLKHAAAG